MAQGSRRDSVRYVVDNHGRAAGDLTVVRTADSIVVRYVFTDRNRGTRLESRYRLGPGGTIVAAESRPVLADGTAGERTEWFEIAGDSARFTSTAGGRGGRGGAGPSVVAARTGSDTWAGLRQTSPWETARLASFLLARPTRTGRLLPSGNPLRAEVVARTSLSQGGRTVPLRLAMVWIGAATTPTGAWIDDRGDLFAGDVQWFIPVRSGAERAIPSLRKLEIAWRNAEAERISAAVRAKANADVVIRNGDVFDSERGLMVPRQTVVLRNDRVVAIGPAGTVAEPPGATVIEATGKTVMPGMWEMHAHLGLSSQSSGSILALSQGITTARDLAADLDVAVSHRDREARGLLASPRFILGGFIEGPQRWAGPSAVVLATEREAREWVARYDSLGYKQIKLYNLVHPDLVPTIADEARKRGMRLSGHIPRGLSVQAAVRLGFDEIQHAAFLFSTFFQDSLYLPQMRAYSQVATAVAPNFDVDGQPMSDLIAFLRNRGTVIDGTFNIWIGGAAAIVGAGGSTDQQRSDAAYLRLITRLHDAGVTLVAGTDNGASATYHRELALYQQAGIPAPEVLQIATIIAARVMGQDREYGSIAAGKVADIAIVNGRPATNVADLSKVETVIRGGRIYQVDELREAVTGRRTATP
jgi:imidazolonepropionase-like amidohydrolase